MSRRGDRRGSDAGRSHALQAGRSRRVGCERSEVRRENRLAAWKEGLIVAVARCINDDCLHYTSELDCECVSCHHLLNTFTSVANIAILAARGKRGCREETVASLERAEKRDGSDGLQWS